MTNLHENYGDDNPHPDRVGFKNFTWTNDSIREWEQTWHALWRIGIKWEWQNSDRYAQKRGDNYHLFAVHNDAAKLDMVVPLPAISAILEIHEYLLDLPTDDHHVDDATNLLRKWMKNYV